MEVSLAPPVETPLTETWAESVACCKPSLHRKVKVIGPRTFVMVAEPLSTFGPLVQALSLTLLVTEQPPLALEAIQRTSTLLPTATVISLLISLDSIIFVDSTWSRALTLGVVPLPLMRTATADLARAH